MIIRLYGCVRLAPHSTQPTLSDSIATLISAFASAKVPLSFGFLSSTGNLTAINKLSRPEQLARAQNNLPPKIRPVNHGAWLTKAATTLAARSPSGRALVESLLPTQLGLGVKGGPEILALLAQTCYLQGYIISAEDAGNAFGNAERERILDAIHDQWPQALALYHLIYSDPSPVLFRTSPDHNGPPSFRVINGANGVRMGCPLSSLSYDALLKDAYANCVAKYPDFVQFGITDDFPAFIPPPTDGNWNALYVRIQQRLAHLDSLTNPLGIFRNDKGALLLPPGAPPPPLNLLSGPQALRPTYDGIIIAGAPVGTPDFVSSFLSDKLTQWQSKINTVTHLGRTEPQIAYHLLSVCTANLPSYLARVVPTPTLNPTLTAFDAALSNARLAILTPPRPHRPPHTPRPPTTVRPRFLPLLPPRRNRSDPRLPPRPRRLPRRHPQCHPPQPRLPPPLFRPPTIPILRIRRRLPYDRSPLDLPLPPARGRPPLCT